jgi:hypothetical protein
MLEPSSKSRPPEIAFFFDEYGPRTAPRRGNSRRSAGNAGADHQHIAGSAHPDLPRPNPALICP